MKSLMGFLENIIDGKDLAHEKFIPLNLLQPSCHPFNAVEQVRIINAVFSFGVHHHLDGEDSPHFMVNQYCILPDGKGFGKIVDDVVREFQPGDKKD